MSRGEIVNLKVFQRVVSDSEVMYKYDAIGLSEQILLDLQKAGVHLIRIVRIHKSDPSQIYYSSVSAFLSSNLKFQHMINDLNFFVPFSHMMLQNRQRQLKLTEVDE